MANQRRPAAAGPAKSTGGGEFEPVRIVRSGKPTNRVVLFSIDDVDYTIPDPIPGSYAVKFLQQLREVEFQVALMRMVDEILGRDAVDALAACDDLTGDDLKAIFDVVGERLMGVVEQAQGK
jgi:hypothetical protein